MNLPTQASQLQAWLDSIDLGQYASVFLAQDINLSILSDLTDADMRELGISLGHRKRLFREIQKLSDQVVASENERAAGQQRLEANEIAERRRITVVFCDLVGSTNLAVRYDPEDLRTVIVAYHNCCQQIVERWNGHVLNYLGDGVVLCFGYPVAHEDGAERAIRASLEIIKEVSSLRPLDGLQLQTRVGIATGEVVIGDLEGDEAMAGATPNLAARLQSLAGADRAVISAGTRRLVEGQFTLESIGKHELKGFSEPLEVWQIKGDLKRANRFEVRRQQRELPLIGRDKEIAKLKACWQTAKGGKGQVVLISGEAGMGKSHLCDALRQFIASEPHVRVRYFCAPYHQNSALYPVINQLENSSGIDVQDDQATKLAKLEARLLSAADGPSLNTALIADLLAIERDERYPALSMTSQRQRIATQEALLEEFKLLSGTSPLLAIFEDAHWSDPTTLEIFGRLFDELIEDLPILILVTHRTDFEPGFVDKPWISKIGLNRIETSDSQKIIAELSKSRGIPKNIVDDIISKSDGVPLFVEELTKAVIGIGSDNQESDPANKFKTLAVPDTLHDSLMAKLDRLKAAKPIAQLGAVIGRRFIYGVLLAVAGLDEDALQNALDDLVKSEVVQAHGEAPTASYTFKHALIQEAAYSSLLRSRVRQLHGEIAGVLEQHFPDMARSEPEVLANHYVKGNMVDKAVDCLMEAGIQAVSRAAQTEAINHFNTAIELLHELPETAERERREIKLHALLGTALIAIKGYAAEDVEETFQLAHNLSIKLNDSDMLCPAMYGLWVVNLARSDRAATIEMADRLQERFGMSSDVKQRIGAAFANGITTFYRGDMEASLGWLDQVLALYWPAQHDALIQSYSDDVALFALAQLEWLETLRGDVGAAKVREAKAFDFAKLLKDPMSMTRSLVFAMMHHRDLRDVEGAKVMADRALQLAGEHVVPFWSALAQCGRGWAMSAEGDHQAGIEMIEQGLSFFPLIDQKLPLTYWNGYLIEALMRAGDMERATQLVDTTINLAETNVDSFFMPALRRCKGILQLRSNDVGKAEASFREARDLAFKQGTRLLEHRATVSLAELLENKEHAEEAKSILLETRHRSPISENTPDHGEAETILARIG